MFYSRFPRSIIGGIVDRNRHKLLTLGKAKAEGIRHARLPIGAHLRMSGSVVLTVNQVLDVLLAWPQVGLRLRHLLHILGPRER